MKRFKKVYLEISNVCNLNCSFCPGTKRAARFMTEDEFDYLTDKLQDYTDYLYFHLVGEPLLHKQLDSFLKTAESKGFKVIITTNGTLLRDRGHILLESSVVHKVNISLQSFEANSGNELESYVSDCASFAVRMNEANKLCVLRLWNKNGLDSLNPRIENIIERFFPKPWETRRQGMKLKEKIWLEPGDKFDWPDIGRGEAHDRLFCYGLRDQIGVLCDGTVVPCCLDHDGEIPLGNLFTEELDRIITGERALRIFDGFSQNKAVEPLCRSCGYATRFSK